MLIHIFAIYVLLQISISENQNCATALSRNPPIDKERKIIHLLPHVHYAFLWIIKPENQNCPTDFRESLQRRISK